MKLPLYLYSTDLNILKKALNELCKNGFIQDKIHNDRCESLNSNIQTAIFQYLAVKEDCVIYYHYLSIPFMEYKLTKRNYADIISQLKKLKEDAGYT